MCMKWKETQKSERDKSMLLANKNLRRNEKEDKLIVFHAVSETLASYCEETVTSGSNLKLTKLSEPRRLYLIKRLWAYSGRSYSSQAEVTLIVATFLQNPPHSLVFPHSIVTYFFTNVYGPQVDKTDTSFSSFPSVPTKLKQESQKSDFIFKRGKIKAMKGNERV